MNDKLIKCVWKHNHLPRHTLNWHIKQMSIWVPTVEGWWKVSSDYCLPLAFYYRANSASSFFLFFLLLLDAHWHPTRDDWRCWYRVSLTACSTSDITTGKKKQQKFSCTRCMFAVRFALLVSYIGSCYVVYAWNIYCVLYKHKHQSSFVTFGGWHTQQLSFRVTNHFSTNKNVRSASFLEEIMASCW